MAPKHQRKDVIFAARVGGLGKGVTRLFIVHERQITLRQFAIRVRHQGSRQARTVMSWNEPEILAARRSIFESARDMLAGHLSYLEGARKIIIALEVSKLDRWDTNLVPFIGIVSETDALPVGAERSHWQAAALEALQPEITRMESWARQFGEPHCRKLVERFSSGEIETNFIGER